MTNKMSRRSYNPTEASIIKAIEDVLDEPSGPKVIDVRDLVRSGPKLVNLHEVSGVHGRTYALTEEARAGLRLPPRDCRSAVEILEHQFGPIDEDEIPTLVQRIDPLMFDLPIKMDRTRFIFFFALSFLAGLLVAWGAR